VRGKTSEWHEGFARGFGDCDVIVVELRGVLEGLNYARQFDFQCIELHSDSQVVVHMLNNKEENYSTCWSICRRIRRLLRLDWEKRIYHTYREANLCADALAYISCTLGNPIMYLCRLKLDI
jgi:ribonuclease HI